MKKYFILLSAAFVSIALASCQKETNKPEGPVVEPKVEEGVIPFELNADITETKTTLNTSTYAVTWDASDVLYAVTTDAVWGDGTSSTDAEGANIATFTYNGEKFTTDKVIAKGEHTFNFIYAGSGQKKYHRATGSTHQLYANQSVDAENPAQNLKANDALVGQITKTIPASLADITMSHIYTLMKVTIKNKIGAAVTASKFEIQIDGEAIAGIFDVSFDTPGVTLKSSASDKITVNISNGSIADNGSIDIYFVMAPVADFTGNVTFSVTDSNGIVYTKTNSVSNLTFAAGSYNTANFSLKPEPVKTFYRITQLEELETGDYIIVGTKTSSSFGLLTYGSLSSSRIPYTESYTSYVSLPTSVDSNDGLSIWHLTVSGTSPKSVKIYNEKKDVYLSSTIAYVNEESATSFNATVDSDMFAFQSESNYLGVNKSANFWKVYAASTLNQTNGLVLYKYEEPSNLASIAIDPSSTHPIEFYKDDVFSSEGLIVKATYENAKVKTVTPTSISAPDMTTVANDVVVTVSYTEAGITKNTSYTIDILTRPLFSVTLGDTSGPEVVLTEASAGSGIELPTRTAPSGYTFEGWCETEVTSATSTEPTIIPVGTYHPSANLTVYPVYSYSENTTTWTKITDLSSVTAGTYALLTENDYAFNGNLSSKFIGQHTEAAFTFTSGVATSAPAGTLEITIAASGSGFTMYAEGKGYLYAAAASKENLKWHDTETSFWISDNGWKYNANNAFLRTLSSDNTFRTYGSRQNQVLNMARKGSSAMTYYISNPT